MRWSEIVYTLAVDIGGTKIAAGVMNEEGVWISEVKNSSNITNANSMYDSVLASMYKAIKKANLLKEQIDYVGIAMPGHVNVETGLAIYQNNLPWGNFPVGEMFSEEFPSSKFSFEHDVVAAALGEWSVRDLSDELLVYITISTGISACIISEGKPIRGNGLAGEIGFFPVNDDKVLETYASGSAMEKELISKSSGLTLEAAFSRWQNGDNILELFFNDRAYQLARSILNVTAIVDPHIIVLGGGVVNNQNKFYELIKEHYHQLCKHRLQQNWSDRIEKSILMSESGLFGVAVKARDSK